MRDKELGLDELSSRLRAFDLGEDERRRLISRLRDEKNRFRAQDLIKIAETVIGERARSGKAAVDDLDRWTRQRINMRRSAQRIRAFVGSQF